MSAWYKMSCSVCGAERTILQHPGRCRSKCEKHGGAKKGVRKTSENAYGQNAALFLGEPIPEGWALTKNGTGNLTRHVNRCRLVLSPDAGLFRLSLLGDPRGRWEPCISSIAALPENVREAIAWAEEKAKRYLAYKRLDRWSPISS